MATMIKRLTIRLAVVLKLALEALFGAFIPKRFETLSRDGPEPGDPHTLIPPVVLPVFVPVQPPDVPVPLQDVQPVVVCGVLPPLPQTSLPVVSTLKLSGGVHVGQSTACV